MAYSSAPKLARRLIAATVGCLLGVGALSLMTAEPYEPQSFNIRADFAYDVSDRELVAGDASVVVVGKVQGTVRQDEHRTVFQVGVLERLEGATPSVVMVSQLGYRTDDGTMQELEDFPLMSEGKTYVMALVAPSTHEPPDALLLLSASPEANRIEVEDLDDPAVDEYRRAVSRQRSPWTRADGVEAQRANDYARWRQGNVSS